MEDLLPFVFLIIVSLSICGMFSMVLRHYKLIREEIKEMNQTYMRSCSILQEMNETTMQEIRLELSNILVEINKRKEANEERVSTNNWDRAREAFKPFPRGKKLKDDEWS